MRQFDSRVVFFTFYGRAAASSSRILSRWKKHVAVWLGFVTSVRRVWAWGMDGRARTDQHDPCGVDFIRDQACPAPSQRLSGLALPWNKE